MKVTHRRNRQFTIVNDFGVTLNLDKHLSTGRIVATEPLFAALRAYDNAKTEDLTR